MAIADRGLRETFVTAYGKFLLIQRDTYLALGGPPTLPDTDLFQSVRNQAYLKS